MADPNAVETNLNQNAEGSEVEVLNKGLGLADDASANANKSAGAEGEEVDPDGEEDNADATTRVDAELEQAENDAEREAIRARRRDERKNRRKHAQEKRDALERQVQSLTQKVQTQDQELAALKNVSQGVQVQQVDRAIQEAEQAHGHFKSVIADATTKGDGATVADATVAMIRAEDRVKELKGYKANMNRAPAKVLDPGMVNHANEFMKRNPWYGGPRSNDPDSKVLTAVDNSLAAENWDPNTKEYWEELESRASKYLGHRMKASSSPGGANGGYNDGADKQRGGQGSGQAKTPVAGSSGNGSSNNGGGKGKMTLSAERVKAIKDAGAWDDPKRRDAMIQRYKAYDAEQQS